MADHNDKSSKQDRRPYERPAVVETASFETLALSCAKIDQFANPFCALPPGESNS